MWAGEYVSGWKDGKNYKMTFALRYHLKENGEVDLAPISPLCMIERVEGSETVKFIEFIGKGRRMDFLEHKMRPEDISLNATNRLYFFLSDEEVKNALAENCETEATS